MRSNNPSTSLSRVAEPELVSRAPAPANLPEQAPENSDGGSWSKVRGLVQTFAFGSLSEDAEDDPATAALVAEPEKSTTITSPPSGDSPRAWSKMRGFMQQNYGALVSSSEDPSASGAETEAPPAAAPAAEPATETSWLGGWLPQTEEEQEEGWCDGWCDPLTVNYDATAWIGAA